MDLGHVQEDLLVGIVLSQLPSPADMRVLRALSEGPMTALQLQSAIGIRKSAIHSQLVRLRTRGLVVGELGVRPPNGRPPYLFRLTRRGAAASVPSNKESDGEDDFVDEVDLASSGVGG